MEIESTSALVHDAPPTKEHGKAQKSTRERYYSDEEDAYDSQEEMKEEKDEEEDDLPSMLQGKKKVLDLVDHSKISYQSFRKDFFVEVPEITNMTPEKVEAYRAELGDIKIRGKGCPKPVQGFHQCGLSQKILDTCKKLNYSKPTPIQAQAIPAIMKGRNAIGIAKTGSGKTLAFLLPMLRHILDQPPLMQGDGPIGLVMAPTRELALQIHSDIKKFTQKLGLRCVCVYGGVNVPTQIGDLKRGAEIVVCTPGRMIDILSTNSGRVTNLRRVTFLALDEADRMFDMGFEPQIMRIIDNIRPDRQTVMFSATFPRVVENAARKILQKPIEIVVGTRSVVCNDVEQVIEVREKDTRFRRLLELLGKWYDQGNILVFVERQETCDTLFRELVRAGYTGLTLHGGMDQTDRHSTISDFKKKIATLMIATSVASRGLDVKDLNLVVNYECPTHLEDYVHRVGRTGRAGNKGTAVTFITPEEEKHAPDLIQALEASKHPVPDELKKLAETYTEHKKMDAKIEIKGSGYGGRGYKFDEAEEAKRNAILKQQKLAYGIQDEEEDSEAEGETADVENAESADASAAPTPAVSAATAATSSSPAAANGAPGSTGALSTPPAATAQVASGQSSQISPAEAAILHQINSLNARTNAPGYVSTKEDATQKARLHVQLINLRAGQRSNQVVVAGANHFTRELEINDYPQQARWKVTHKDALSAITEFTSAAITARGKFYPPGRNPEPGERKLYLYIEGSSEQSVKTAKQEIKRILSEAVLLAIPERAQYGKYQVV